MTDDRENQDNADARPSKEEMYADHPRRMSGPSIDAERIAALIDGRLDAKQRAALLAELEASPEAFEAYGDALAAMHDMTAGPMDGGRGTPGGQRVTRPFPTYAAMIALAATILIAVVLPVIRARTARLEEPSVIAGALQTTAASTLLRQPAAWSELRGANDALSERARAVRIGARLVELELLVRNRDTAANRVAGQVASLLDAVPGGGPAAAAYRALADQPMPSISASALGRAASVAEDVAGATDIRVGAWLEAARVAAAQRDTAFFQPTQTRPVERAMGSLQGLSPEATRVRAELSRVLAAPTRDWPALESTLEALLREIATS